MQLRASGRVGLEAVVRSLSLNLTLNLFLNLLAAGIKSKKKIKLETRR